MMGGAGPKSEDGGNAGDSAENPLSSNGEEPFDTSTIFARMQEQADGMGLFNKLDSVPFCMEILTYAISPLNIERLVWDSAVLGMVFYSTFSEPYSAAFFSDPADEDHVFWNTFGQVVDLLFWVDILANFFTGFDRGFEIVLSKPAIVMNYCFGWGWFGGWFWVDLVATIDWVWVAGTMGSNSADAPIIRMMRLLKVLRLARASRLINRLTATLSVHTGYIEALKFFMYVGIVAHLLACFFYLWPVLTECDNDPAVANSVFNEPTDFTHGWHHKQSCMQGSWRQNYNIEQVCPDNFIDTGKYYDLSDQIVLYELRVCQETSEFYLEDGELYQWAVREGVNHTALCEQWWEQFPGEYCPYVSSHRFQARKCSLCMRSMRLYIDAMYWSLTTMTTIGYGDRGPQTEFEIVFVMFAEVFGLAFFALLLTQINKVADVMGESSEVINQQKNGVVQFLIRQHLDKELVDDTVRYLNFRAGALSGNSFDPDDEKFSMLSPGLKNRIQTAVYRPVLENVRIFGWNPIDWEEERAVQEMFNKIDTDSGGTLDRQETQQLFAGLDLKLTEFQFESCFSELDSKNTGEITYVEFKRWWYLKKNGRPQITKCPSDFLDFVCTKLKTDCYGKGERLVQHGTYGDNFIILLSGKCQVMRDTNDTGHADHSERDDSGDQIVDAQDREPVLGFMACLPEAQWAQVRARTDDWVAKAVSYVDTAWVKRQDVLNAFRDTWPEGQEEMCEVAFHHYEVQRDDEGGSARPKVELEGDVAERLETLNNQLNERMNALERRMDAKLNDIVSLIKSQSSADT